MNNQATITQLEARWIECAECGEEVTKDLMHDATICVICAEDRVDWKDEWDEEGI